jgi:dihydroorotate dehydrogenase (fumarate)
MTVDLTTDYLGLRLPNPLVVASCPLTGEVYRLQQLEQAGAAAAVLPSLFEEQIRHEDALLASVSRRLATGENPSYVSGMDEYNAGPDSYLRHLEAAKRAVKMPIIASLNGCLTGDWTRFARLIQNTGADALELNIYFLAVDPAMSGRDVEERYVDLVHEVRAKVAIPLAVKIGPYFSSLPEMARRLVEAGANGLVLFNRFLQPDLDLNALDLHPTIGLSHRNELQLRIRWVSILRGQLSVSLAATGGAHLADDVVGLLLAGADVAMLASVLMRHGPRYLDKLLNEIALWIEAKGFASVERMKGIVNQRCADHLGANERRNYIASVTSLARGAKPEAPEAPVESPDRDGRDDD